MDFLHKPEGQGTVIYLIHDGTERDRAVFERLQTHLERRTKKPTIMISAREENGRKIIQYFHLRGSHFVLLVRGNDELHHMWTDGDQIEASHIAHMAEQVR